MYCARCGNLMKDSDVFCERCGLKSALPGESGAAEKADSAGEENAAPEKSIYAAPDAPPDVVPSPAPVAAPAADGRYAPNKKTAALVVGVSAISAAFVAVVAVAVVVIVLISGSLHDLRGTYNCTANMQLTSFTFNKDGSVTAVNYYCPNDYDYGVVYHGKYKKHIGYYEVILDDYEAGLYDISVEKVGDGVLEIGIGHSLSYLASYAKYYKAY